MIEVWVLILSFLLLLGLGVPVAWSIGISSLLTLLISMDTIAAFTIIAQRLGTGLDSFPLLAIPFFILAGKLMNSGGIARRLIDFAKSVVGSLPGGLAHINIIAAMLFGAISGSAVAAASAIGGFMSKRMEQEGYTREFGAAVNITASTTGLVIPPSNILIVYSLASGGASIAALFLAGYIPGLLIGLLLMIMAFIWAKRNKKQSEASEGFKTFIRSFVKALPSLFLLVVIMGGIVGGIFTATEASAVAVLYCLVLTVIYKEVKFKDFPKVFLEAAKTSGIVMLLIGTSMSMSWVMSYENIPQDVSRVLLSLSDNLFVILFIINITLLLVGIFMDITPSVLIFTPIFLPAVTSLGMDPVHFGIVMVVNLCIGLCTPPVGNLLFVGVSVANTSIMKVIKPLMPLFLVMLLALFAITYIPALSLWLPGLFGF